MSGSGGRSRRGTVKAGRGAVKAGYRKEKGGQGTILCSAGGD